MTESAVKDSLSELQARFWASPRNRDEVRAAVEPFLRRHVLLDPTGSPSSRVAAGLASMVP